MSRPFAIVTARQVFGELERMARRILQGDIAVAVQKDGSVQTYLRVSE